MKNQLFKVFTLVLLVACTTQLSAQHKFFIGGKGGFNSSGHSESEAKTVSYSVSPYIGYSASEHIIVGLSLGYEGTKLGLSDTDKDTYSKNGDIVISPFVRYRKAANEKLGVYGELGFGYGMGNTKSYVADEQVGETSKTSSFNVYVGPGIDYAFSDRWAINALWGALSYKSTKVKDSEGSRSDLGLNLNPAALTFSLNYCF